MKKQLAKLALTAAIGLALTFTQAAATPLTDSRDKKTYKTVKIGEQVWMAENLNYEAKEGSMCYDNKPANCQKYGRLYGYGYWDTYCPSGWHLPSNAEWDKLLHYVDGTSGTESPYNSKTAGKYLKAKSGWNENGNGTDKFGFSALPGGNLYFSEDYTEENFGSIGAYGCWWSTSDDSNAFARQISGNEVNYSDDEREFSDYCSVRCIKD